MFSSKRRGVLLALATLLVGAGARADDPGEENQARALKLLEESCRYYHGLAGYADDGRFVASGKLDDHARLRRRPMSLKFARPNKIDLRVDGIRLVSDGKVMRTFLPALRAYDEVAAPEALDYEQLVGTPIGIVTVTNPGFLTINIFLTMCFSEPAKAVEYIMAETGGITMEADRQVGGRTVKPLVVDQQAGPDFRLFIDPETKRLAGVEIVLTKEEAQAQPDGATIDRAVWLAAGAKAEAPADEAFRAEIPPGYRKEDTLVQEAAGQLRAGNALLGDPMELIGRPLADFRADVVDGDRLRPLARADLAGQPALIVFWSAGDAASLDQLREVVALAAPAGDGRILALGLDDDPGDPAARRMRIEAALKLKPAESKGLTVSLDAGEPAAALAVSELPATFLIDAKGLIQSVHVGPIARDVLDREWKAVREGRPLAPAPAPDKD